MSYIWKDNLHDFHKLNWLQNVQWNFIWHLFAFEFLRRPHQPRFFCPSKLWGNGALRLQDNQCLQACVMQNTDSIFWSSKIISVMKISKRDWSFSQHRLEMELSWLFSFSCCSSSHFIFTHSVIKWHSHVKWQKKVLGKV